MFALSLSALVMVAGVGFDYARLAGMDSELQNAADQAALAAASQLDGRTGACGRANAAARGLVSNWSLLANDGSGPTVTIPDEGDNCNSAGNVRFYRDKAKTQEATTAAQAKFVEIRVNSRVAKYLFTPVVASESTIDAAAFAGLGSAVCKVPPVMLCNPNETADPNFVVANYEGKGVRLVGKGNGNNADPDDPNSNGGGIYGQGLFGFLETANGNGASSLGKAIGQLTPPGDCVEETGVEPSTGNMQSVRGEFNTRFDIYEGVNNACSNDGSLCPPAVNTRKDVYISGSDPSGGATFSTGNGNNANTWFLPNTQGTQLYPPSVLTTVRTLTNTEISGLWPMGFPRDICHATGTTGLCNAFPSRLIGDGVWDYNAYFRSNTTAYPSVPTSGEMSSWFKVINGVPTRYSVYKYESLNAGTRLASQSIAGLGNGNNQRTQRPQPVNRTGISPTATVPDRRVLTAAVINCTANNVSSNSTNVPVQKWVDLFLVEPSLPRPRTFQSDVYVEIIGETKLGAGGGTTGNAVRRDVPYLIE